MKKNCIYLNICFNMLISISILTRVFSLNNNSASFCTAYLDPGTGTMIISAIVGILATLILGIKTFWYKIASIFKPKKKN